MPDHPLAAHTGAFRTAVGAAFPGERAVFRGRDLHAEVMHGTTFLQLCALAVGHELTADQAALLDTVMVSTSYPDARIWCNRVASLAGSTRSTPTLALAAAHAAADARIYGRGNEHRAVAFLQRTLTAVRAGSDLDIALSEQIRTYGSLPGFGRPLHNGDERIIPWMRAARQYGAHDGDHVRLAFTIDERLKTSGKPLRMNAGGLVAAFGADFGFTPRQWAIMLFPGFLAGMSPCYLEALEKPVGAVFAARCDQVEYTGAPARTWDRTPARA